MRARYRRVATPAADGFPGFPELAHGIAAASGSKVYTDQARHLRQPKPVLQSIHVMSAMVTA